MSLFLDPRRSFFGVTVCLLFQFASSEKAAAQHHYRPALVGNGPKSLVNLIDRQKLVEKGQRDGVVMFDAAVDDDASGSVTWIWCHASPEAKALKAEVEKELLHASFVPAMIDGKRVSVEMHGTAMFTVRDGRPYLKVFANQDPDELARQSDYIQPQMLVDSEDWEDARPMLEVVRLHARAGHAVLSITVDGEGNVRDRHLVREEPGGLNIGAAAMKTYSTARFTPGFRNGKAVACTFNEDWAVRGYRYRRW
jgi:hypothetical protein